jgi:hypothetical protein
MNSQHRLHGAAPPQPKLDQQDLATKRHKRRKSSGDPDRLFLRFLSLFAAESSDWRFSALWLLCPSSVRSVTQEKPLSMM